MTVDKNKVVQYINLGIIDYQEAWDKQIQLFEEIISIKLKNRTKNTFQPTPNYLIFCSHPNVYTLGKSGNEKNLLLTTSSLDQKGIDFYHINRGGDITFHGPGQIVGYPILDLENFFTDIHKYLRALEESVIRTLMDYDIIADRIDGLTGVWIDVDTSKPRKICALGVKTSRWVTMHGFAFNVRTDLSYYEYIIPCGIDDKAITSLNRELGYEPDMSEVEKKLLTHLSEIFEMELKNGK